MTFSYPLTKSKVKICMLLQLCFWW